MSAATQPHQSRGTGKKDPGTGLINAFSRQPLRHTYVRAELFLRKTSGCIYPKGSTSLPIDKMPVTIFFLNGGVCVTIFTMLVSGFSQAFNPSNN